MLPFEDVFIESIANCGTNDFGSGLKAKLFFAPAEYFSEITLPSATDFQNYLLISENDISFKSGNSWSYVDCLIDENELKFKLNGSLKRKRIKPSLDVFILGLRAKVLGFLEILKNEDLVFIIQTYDGISILFGTLINTAHFENADGTSGKKYEDNSGVSVALTTNASIYFFQEKLIITPIDSSPVDLSSNSGGFIDITKDY